MGFRWTKYDIDQYDLRFDGSKKKVGCLILDVYGEWTFYFGNGIFEFAMRFPGTMEASKVKRQATRAIRKKFETEMIPIENRHRQVETVGAAHGEGYVFGNECRQKASTA